MEFNFDTEVDLKEIQFSKNIAEQQERYVSSISRGEKYKKQIEVQRSIKAGFREFFKEPDQVINLVVSMILWAIMAQVYVINNYYYYYFPGDQFESYISICCLELVAYIVSEQVFEKVFKKNKVKNLFYFSYFFCLIGGIGIIINNPEEHPYLDLIFQFIAKFGCASAYMSAYMTTYLFPVVFSSSTFGFSVMFGSISSFVSQWTIASYDNNLPWYIFIGLSGAGIIVAFFFREYW
jgi:hypothetical protein